MIRLGNKLHELDAMDIHFFWELFEENTESLGVVITNADDVPWL